MVQFIKIMVVNRKLVSKYNHKIEKKKKNKKKKSRIDQSMLTILFDNEKH